MESWNEAASQIAVEEFTMQMKKIIYKMSKSYLDRRKKENAKNKNWQIVKQALVSDSHDPVGVLMWFLGKSHTVINKK